MITTDLAEITARLSAFFPADEVKSFPMSVTKDKSKGLAAFYIDARAVQNRLDETCYWAVSFRPDPRGGGKSVMAGISVYVALPDGKMEWVTRWDGADNSDIEATKGGLSGAVRRAAVTWGVGRYLYKVPAQWVPMAQGGKRFSRDPVIPAAFTPGSKAKGSPKKPPVEKKEKKPNQTPELAKAEAYKALVQGCEATTRKELDAAVKKIPPGLSEKDATVFKVARNALGLMLVGEIPTDTYADNEKRMEAWADARAWVEELDQVENMICNAREKQLEAEGKAMSGGA